jgi:hypothetical protein
MLTKHMAVKYFSIICTFAVLSACGGGDGQTKSSIPVPVETAPPPVPAVPEQLRVFVIGQSISSNCNEHKFGPVENVFQVGLNGDVKAAQDPFEWADCTNGSMWMPLGKLIVERGLAKQVIFMPIGVSGTTVRDWQEGGLAYPKLNNAIAQIKQKRMAFDVALWHQGSSDIGTDKNVYLSRLGSVVDYIDARIPIGRWVIAVHSRCFGNYDKNIEDAQRAFIATPGTKRYLGPNNNLLGNEFRVSDACHLNERGQQEMASMWFDAIQAALKSK